MQATGEDLTSYVSMTSDWTDKSRSFDRKHGLIA
jgi:hypothetical protein